jgi:hypothetical protein
LPIFPPSRARVSEVHARTHTHTHTHTFKQKTNKHTHLLTQPLTDSLTCTHTQGRRLRTDVEHEIELQKRRCSDLEGLLAQAREDRADAAERYRRLEAEFVQYRQNSANTPLAKLQVRHRQYPALTRRCCRVYAPCTLLTFSSSLLLYSFSATHTHTHTHTPFFSSLRLFLCAFLCAHHATGI